MKCLKRRVTVEEADHLVKPFAFVFMCLGVWLASSYANNHPDPHNWILILTGMAVGMAAGIFAFYLVYEFFGGLLRALIGMGSGLVALSVILTCILAFSYGWSTLVMPHMDPCMFLEAHM
jgi:hypothetical protein